jgi:hypothetical protein
MNDKNDPINDALEREIKFILDVFGRKQQRGEPPLESLPPSRRLIPNAPLNEQERNVVALADFRYHGSKLAPKDDRINQTGHSDGSLEPSQPGLPQPQPRKKTLTELLKEHGIKEAPPDDPVYRTKFVVYLPGPLKQPSQNKPLSSETSTQHGPPQNKWIDRNSKEPEDRQRWIWWLGDLSLALRAPQQILLPRVREVLSSAQKDGVNWRDLYEVAKDIQPDRCPQAPDLELVDPDR